MTATQPAHHIVPKGFEQKRYRVSRTKPCPICEKPDWCLSDWETWAICKRVDSPHKFKEAGHLHRLGNPAPKSKPPAPSHPPVVVVPPPLMAINPETPSTIPDFDSLPEIAQDLAGKDYARHYNLDPENIPPDICRNYTHKTMGNGSLFRGLNNNLEPVFKFKTFSRGPDGKRRAQFMSDSGTGFLVMPNKPGSPVVVVGGEEKALAAWQAGYSVLSPLSGESTLLSERFHGLIHEWDPPGVFFANDNDKPGAEANEKGAVALELTGWPADKTWIIVWPAGFKKKGDLNDLDGPESIRTLLQAAKPFRGRLPRVLSLDAFLVVERPPLQYHIDGVLPYGGKMTISATSKFGKSMLAIQIGLVIAAGHCAWLGWKFGPSAKVLYLQAEIMDELMAGRCKAIMESMPHNIEPKSAAANFMIQEISMGRPNLYTDDGKAKAEALIKAHKPEVLILDPLSALCPGMEENAAESMGLVLDYFSHLANRYKLAPIVVHHHGKAGHSRGSSVFEAWPETDIQATRLKDDLTIAQVDLKLRCAFNRGPVYWQMPSENNLWFQPMPENWEPETVGRKRMSQEEKGLEAVRILRTFQAAPKYGILAETISKEQGMALGTAQERISFALKSGQIHNREGRYFPGKEPSGK